MTAPTTVLLNPAAGGGRGARLHTALRTLLSTRHPNVVLVCPDSATAARSLLMGLPIGSRVVIVGGDGTLNQCLPALLARDLILGLVPLGSGNDFARSLGVHGLSWQAALALSLTGQAQAVDIGLARFKVDQLTRSVPFISSFSAGFDASVAQRASAGPQWLRGLPRYLLATLKELRKLRRWPLVVRCDQQMIQQGPTLLVATLNTPSYGGGMPAAPEAKLQDGWLDGLIGADIGLARVLVLLPALLLGKHQDLTKVTLQKYRSMEVTCTEPLPIAADGESLGHTEALHITVLAKALRVVMP
jgi:diacylglycerol kinase (ATP)